MATNVYLGYPPPNVRAWIESKYRKTVITFEDGHTEEYEWSGKVSKETLIGAGIQDSDRWTWLKRPASVQFGTTVTQIESYTLNYCDSLTSVSMPNVTTVGECAFYFSSPTSVSMPNVTTIGESAFRGTRFTSVSMPNVTTVGVYAFGDCESLTSVSMPNVTTVGEGAFYDIGYISDSLEFKNQTTSEISEWFGNQVFGGGGWGPVTVICSNGSVYAEWDPSENKWNTEITPAQQ